MTDRVRKYVPAMVEVFVSDMDCYVCMANYRNLERDLAKARYDTIMNGLRLKSASASLKEEDLVQINTLLH